MLGPAHAKMDVLLPEQAVTWLKRCTRGSRNAASCGETLAVLVAIDFGIRVVDVAVGVSAYSSRATVSFFRVSAFLKLPGGQAAAVVHPYLLASGQRNHSVRKDKFLSLRMHDPISRGPLLRWRRLK